MEQMEPTREQDERAEQMALHFDSVGVTMRPDGIMALELCSSGFNVAGYGKVRTQRQAQVRPDGSFVGGFSL